MKYKVLITALLTLIFTTSCSENITNQNIEQNENSNEKVVLTNENLTDLNSDDNSVTEDLVTIEYDNTSQISESESSTEDVDTPNISERPIEYDNIELENFISENTIFALSNFEAKLGFIVEAPRETTAYYGINGYDPSDRDITPAESDNNTLILTWKTDKSIDVQESFSRTAAGNYTYLDDNQQYLHHDYPATSGVILKNIVWLEHGTLFKLTMPASLYNETSTIEMFKVEITENPDTIEQELSSTETIGSDIVEPEPMYVNNNSEPVAVDPVIPPEIANP